MITLHNHTVPKRKSLLGFETANIYKLLAILRKVHLCKTYHVGLASSTGSKASTFHITVPNFCGGLKLALARPPELLLSKYERHNSFKNILSGTSMSLSIYVFSGEC